MRIPCLWIGSPLALTPAVVPSWVRRFNRPFSAALRTPLNSAPWVVYGCHHCTLVSHRTPRIDFSFLRPIYGTMSLTKKRKVGVRQVSAVASPEDDNLPPRRRRQRTPDKEKGDMLSSVARQTAETSMLALDSSNRESLEAMTKVTLVACLRERGGKVSGSKQELVDRLLALDSATATLGQSTTASKARKRAMKPASAKPENNGKVNKAKMPLRQMIPRDMTERASHLPETCAQLRVLSWNVNGLRAMMRKEEGRQALVDMISEERPHIIGLQETKIQVIHEEEMTNQFRELLPDYETHWYCSEAKKGYSGTALVIRKGDDGDTAVTPVSVRRGIGQEEGDQEGRVLTAEYESMFVVNVYTPNSGDGLRRLKFRTDLWDLRFGEYVRHLEESKPVVVVGDLNVAHADADFFNPSEKRTLTQAGTTPEERQSFAVNLLGTGTMQSVAAGKPFQGSGAGLVDTFRVRHPNAAGVFSYWSMRAGNRAFNRGMRLDYCLASPTLAEDAHDAFVLDATVGVSDHCPVGCVLRL
ncbi:unnamed protein product [Discosporangium mesarthrocarpum]